MYMISIESWNIFTLCIVEKFWYLLRRYISNFMRNDRKRQSSELTRHRFVNNLRETRTYQWILLEVTPEYTRGDSLIIPASPLVASRRDRSSRFMTAVTISTAVIRNDARATRRAVVVEDEAALEFHRDGALTFRGLESTGIIDQRLPFDERPCYSILSGMVTTNCVVRPRAERRNATATTSWTGFQSFAERKRSGID